VRLKRVLAFAFLAACGGVHETVAQKPQVLPLPPPSAVPLGDGGPSTAACLDTYDGGKPVDPAALANADAASLSESERLYVRGGAYFTAEQWVLAAKAFRAVAFDAPDSSQGVYGSQLYLELLNQLGAHARRASCFDDIARDVPLLHELYCGARRQKSGDTCALLERIDSEVTRLRAERLEQRGDHRAAAEQFLVLLGARCSPARPELRCDEIAFNAAVLFLSANDEPSARNIRTLMTDPKNKMDKSPLVEKLACRLDGATGRACH
jgi:hypothetical protein